MSPVPAARADEEPKGSPMEYDRFSVEIEGKRVEISVQVSSIGHSVELVVFTNDPFNPRIERYTDDEGATFRYKIVGSPLTSMENDQQQVSVLRRALSAWRQRSKR
jgi:hypothetical protein